MTHHFLQHKFATAGFIAIIASLGTYFILSGLAATYFGSGEAEHGTLTGPAVVRSGTDASGGQYLQFGSPASATLGVKIVNGKLVDAGGQGEQLVGVDTSGTEDSCVQEDKVSFAPLNAAEATGMENDGVKVVRVPLNEDCWLGINGVPADVSGMNYQNAIKQWVNLLHSDGIIVILDLHWAAPSNYEATEQWPMIDADHGITFWSQVATAYASDPAIIYDVFNEPFMGYPSPTADNWNCWENGCSYSFNTTINGTATDVTYQTAGMQQVVTAIRSTGATQPILLGGLNFTAEPCTTGLPTNASAGSCMWLNYKPKDPLNQLIADYHNYQRNKNCGASVANTDCWNEQVQPLNAAGVPLLTAELGEEDCASGFISSYVNWADQNNVSYLAWVWAPTAAGTTQCVSYDYPSVTATASAVNHDLMSNYDGSASTVAPEGAFYIAHMLARSKASN